jgi:hypothetical protein
MKIKTISLFLAIFLFAAAAVQAGKVEKLIEDNLVASGEANLAKTATWKVEGTISAMGQSFAFHFVLTQPDKFYYEQEAGSMKVIMGSNGTQGWLDQGGKKMLVPIEAVKNQFDQFNFLKSPLSHYNKEEDGELKLVGRETINEKEAYKLNLVSPSGEDVTYYVGKDDNLVFKMIIKMNANGQEQVITLDFADFKIVAGVNIPHKVDLDLGMMKQTFVYTNVLPGFEFDTKSFDPPAGAEPIENQTPPPAK